MTDVCGLATMSVERSPGSESRDFFRTRAQSPLSETFLMIGTRCELSTNSESILKWARKLFASLPANVGRPEVKFLFWADDDSTLSQNPWPKPYFRGFGRFIFAGFDSRNSLLVDLHLRQVIGRFTRAFADDEAVWKKVVFPVIPAFLAPSVPVSILHGACVEHKGHGLLLVGPSGSGKSTLTWELGRLGFGYLADDRTYLSTRNGRLFAWSVGGFLKLRLDAAPQLNNPNLQDVTTRQKEDDNLELDPEGDLGFKRVKCCEPHCLVFLEKGDGEAPFLRRLDSTDAIARLVQNLNSDAADTNSQNEIILGLAQMPSYVLRNQGSSTEAAQALTNLLGNRDNELGPTSVSKLPPLPPVGASTGDPLRRLTPLDYTLSIGVMGRMGVLHTNSSAVLEMARTLFPKTKPDDDSPPAFRWRIVSETDEQASPRWPTFSAFSSEALRFVNMGQRSFIATNVEAKETLGFISASLAKDEPGFVGIFLSTLFYLTVPTLGLTPLRAACVARGGRGLLLLGPPRSGKTSCAYSCSKLGLEYHADMAIFLELQDDHVRSWGEFWPALFREESSHTYPELKFLARRLNHQSESFLSVEKKLLCSQPARPITPAVAVVLERTSDGSPRMTRLNPREYSSALFASPPYQEVGCFKTLQEKVLARLLRIPAYKLTYGNNPVEAAIFCRSLLTAQDILKAVP